MPRKQMISLNKLIDEGYDVPFIDSGIDLGAALQTLSQHERTAIRIRFFGRNRASYDEVGNRLKTNRNEASRIVRNAIEKLRETLN